MAKLSLSEVSKRFNVSRSTIYRAIKEGRISRSADSLFDIAEVIRCFGEPVLKSQEIQPKEIKDDADLRQLVDFMKREIESYKDRELRYLDQIDRFQLLLGHKEETEKKSHETPLERPSDTPRDNINKTPETPINKEMKHNEKSHETPVERPSTMSLKQVETPNETPEKKGFWSRFFLPNG